MPEKLKKIPQEINPQIEQLDENYTPKSEIVTNESSPLQEVVSPLLNNEEIKRYEKQQKIKRNWRLKVMRFLSFCLSGSLTDFTITYDKFINDFFYKIQTSNTDIQEMLFQIINIMEANNRDSKGESTKEKIFSLNDNSKLIFNEDALANSIKTGFLARYMSENPQHFPKLMKTILTNHCSNKILSKTRQNYIY